LLVLELAGAGQELEVHETEILWQIGCVETVDSFQTLKPGVEAVEIADLHE
jgi:hypothetical protein